jgi:competence protein CoiA
VPLTAVHAELGLLDATLPDLGGVARWEDVHRVQPPAPLSCRACTGAMSAKVSKLGMRFFAHRAHAVDCPTLGETIQHRLLKIELAAAIRDAGWTAELEVPGNGWRADVLATAPDRTRRVAFEAQLATATIDDLAERTATMAADGVEVCWVTDKDTTWVTHVPSARVRRPGDSDDTPGGGDAARPGLDVIDGHAAFEADWCPDRDRCGGVETWGQHRVPCPGHGRWTPAPQLTLTRLVAGICAGSIRLHDTVEPVWFRRSRHDGGQRIWTTRPHHDAELEQRRASAAYEQWAAPNRAAELRRAERAARERLDHVTRIEALLARQRALIQPTVEFVYQTIGSYPRVEDGTRSPRFAMGVPVFVGDKLTAVICPVATRITPGLAGWFSTATIVVAGDEERARIAAVTHSGQRFKVIDPGPLPAPEPRQPTDGITVQQAVRRMFRGFD